MNRGLFGSVPVHAPAFPGAPVPETLKRLDRVRISNGSVLIVTGYRPNAPVNCYTGVLENGKGKEYVFGPRHKPQRLGVVTEDHPALEANQDRKEAKAGIDPVTRAEIDALVSYALTAGKTETAAYEIARRLEVKGYGN